jgi:BirA family transcriptional regulator, biotin operon repressor / biotin---[acetyl-CoA-carboxylase] ligase
MSTAERILERLRSSPRSWTSGQCLSRELSLSRSAVWKHIRSLRREGYEIDSAPRKGYRLAASSSRLLPWEIRAGLMTEVLGRREIVFFTETDSTNTRAKALAASGAPEGTLVIAECQTGGRGRKGRTWFSPRGEGIYLSVILRPCISPVQAPSMTLIAGIAAAEMLAEEFPGLDVHIKWPNDILAGRRKVAGILTEISADMDEVAFVVSGVGLNVNARVFPSDIRDIATSIALETGASADRAHLVRRFLESYERWYRVFLAQGTGPVLDRWKSLSRTLGNRVVVDGPGGRIEGIARDVDRQGGLMVEDDEGLLHPVFSGDVGEP